MSLWRRAPGRCIVCDAPQCACRSDTGPIAIVQTPERDAMAARAPAPSSTPAAERMQATLPPGQVTTGTYRREKQKRDPL